MTSDAPAKPRTIPRWYSWIGLLAWVALLGHFAYHIHDEPFDLASSGIRSGRALLQLARSIAWTGFASFAKFLPVGFLAVLAFRPRERGTDRVLRVGLPALATSWVIAAVVGCVQPSKFATPDWPVLILPWAGCLVGWWAAMAFRRGRVALLLFVPQLLLAGVLFAVASGALLSLAIDSNPLELRMPTVTSAEKRRLYSLFSGKNPLKLEEGKVVELSLTADDINLLLAWGLPLGDTARSALVELVKSGAKLRASAQIPRTSKYINVTAEGLFSLSNGNLQLHARRLRVGRLEMPTLLLAGLSHRVTQMLTEDARVKPLLDALHGAEITDGVATLTYGHGSPPKGFFSKLFHDAADEPLELPVIHAQLLNLLASKTNITGTNDARFAGTVQTAFRYAREHSSDGAVKANRAAVLALGIVLGHPRVESLTGKFLDDNTRTALKAAFSGTTMRKRDDWPKHFFVSAALTIIAAGNVSDATGLFKEEKDADGGSGFSFGDLLADRSGTTFAQVATRNEASARALQERLNQGFNIDDYFPPAEGLPEGIQDADFQRQYGGVGGEGYRRFMAEIERRVAQCAAYR